MEVSKTSILDHETPGLFEDYPEVQHQIDELASKIQSNGENPKLAMSRWLQCGKTF